jgi:electron transport complex protein RnfC
VRIGTPAAAVLAALDATPEPGGKLLLGSPMRGVACPDPTHPVTPDTKQLVLQAPGEVHHFQSIPCTNCGGCDRVCPVDLQVSALSRFAEYDRYDRCADLAVERCVDCGLCAYVCPAHRPVAQLMMHAKQTLWRSPERRVAPVDTGGCNACGPTCPALRLFDLDAEPVDRGKEKQA